MDTHHEAQRKIHLPRFRPQFNLSLTLLRPPLHLSRSITVIAGELQPVQESKASPYSSSPFNYDQDYVHHVAVAAVAVNFLGSK